MPPSLLSYLVMAMWLALAGGCYQSAGQGDGTAPGVHIASWVQPKGDDVAIERIVHLAEGQWNSAKAAQNHGFTERVIWFRIDFSLPAAASSSPWVLEFANPVLDHLDIYLPDGRSGHGGWQIWRLGDKLPFAARPLPTRNFSVPLDLPPGTAAKAYVRVESGSSVQLPVRLLTYQDLQEDETRSLVVHSGYIGLIVGLLLFNLSLLLRIRETLYLYYVGWLFLVAVFVLCMEGVAFQYFWPDRTDWHESSIVLSLLLSMFFLTAFWLRFHADFIGRLKLPGNAMSAGIMVLLVAGAILLPYRIAIQLTIAIVLGLAIGLIWLAVHAIRRGFTIARTMLISFLPMFLAGVLLAAQRFGLIGDAPLSDYAIEAGSALQGIMLSLLLADRLTRMRELGAAASEMQRFNRSLEASNSALEASNSALVESLRVAEARSQAIVAMEEKLRSEAEARSRDKSRFLAQAVHDLKQPLQAISLALSPIKSLLESGATARTAEMIDLVQHATQVMRGQISGLLDLSRLESGVVRPSLGEFPVRTFLEQLLASMETFARAKGVRLEIDHAGPAALAVRSDVELLRQILTNIVGNAIKYADNAKAPSCRVRLRYETAEGQVLITVEDNGIGIEDDHLASGAIFQPFFQAHNSLPEGEKGVGLGLSIVNAVLALLPDHRLSVESRFGVGSQFRLRLPRGVVPLGNTVADPLAAKANLAQLAGKYIVLVDDDLLVRTSTVALLDCYGVLHDEFDSLASLSEKLTALDRKPDALLSDYRLPDEKTALDVVSLVASVWPDVPTVVVTGDAVAVAEFKARGAAFAVLHKPVSPMTLLDALAKASTRHGD